MFCAVTPVAILFDHVQKKEARPVLGFPTRLESNFSVKLQEAVSMKFRYIQCNNKYQMSELQMC